MPASTSPILLLLALRTSLLTSLRKEALTSRLREPKNFPSSEKTTTLALALAASVPRVDRAVGVIKEAALAVTSAADKEIKDTVAKVVTARAAAAMARAVATARAAVATARAAVAMARAAAAMATEHKEMARAAVAMDRAAEAEVLLPREALLAATVTHPFL